MMTKIKIKKGQRWRKKDSGAIMAVKRKHLGDVWSCLNERKGNNAGHHIREHDLRKHYDLIN